MRRLIPLLALMACASPGAPPGGPEDHEPPKLIKQSPDSDAVNVRPRRIELVFDEVVSERPSTSGAQSLRDLFLISPRDGAPTVGWHRSRLEVRPRRGWRPNTAYTVRLLPGLADLRGNRDTVGHVLVFSTGPTIPSSYIAGYVFDWLGSRIAPDAYIEAIARPDTTLRYVSVADTSGHFIIPHIPPGQYTVRAIVDGNRNRSLDNREASDTATVTLTDSVVREMLAFVRDTIGPGIASVTVRDSLILRVLFDRPVDTAQRITPALFTLKGSDSASVEIAAAMTMAEFEKAEQDSAAARARADSLKRLAAADSARRADSLRAAATPRPPQARQPERIPPPAVARDTTKGPRPPRKPSIPPPALEVVLRLAAPPPLKPGASYKLRAENIRSLVGRSRTSERVFTTDKRAPVADTTKARPDSTRRRPPP